MYPGQHMSIEDNIFYAKRNIVDSIWKEANIEESISRSLLQKRFSKVLKLLT